MDKAYIDNQQVIDRYVSGRLTADELDAFEIYLLDHPALLADIEYARAFSERLRDVADTLHPAAPANPTGPAGGVAPAWRLWGVAATGLLLVAGGSLLVVAGDNARLEQALSASQAPVALTEDLWLESLRSGAGPVAQLPAGAANLLRIDVGPDPMPSYLVTLAGQEDAARWSLPGLRADDENTIRLQVAGLPPDRYTLSVFATGRNGADRDLRHRHCRPITVVGLSDSFLATAERIPGLADR